MKSPAKHRSSDRARVMNGSLAHTSGGLTKSNLKYNKQGRIVQKSRSHPIVGKLGKKEFYCVACQKRVKPLDGEIKTGKARVTHQPMLKAYCAKCESKVAKFVKA